MNLRIHFFPAICFPVSVYVTSKLSIETTWVGHKIHARCLIKLKLAVSPFLKGFWKCRRCNYACLQRSRQCSGHKKKQKTKNKCKTCKSIRLSQPVFSQMHYRMIQAYFFAWYPRNERHHNQKSKRHWWDCQANIPNVQGTHHLYCCRSHTSILAGASQIALKWGKNNMLLSKMIPISWWEHHKKISTGDVTSLTRFTLGP